MLCLVVAGAAVAILAGRGDDKPEVSTRTLSAEAFVDSIGVNTHLGYADTAYADHARVLARLDELGVRHFRDSAADANPLLAIRPRTVIAVLEAGDDFTQLATRWRFADGESPPPG